MARNGKNTLNKNSLYTRRYDIQRNLDELPIINVEFVLPIAPTQINEIAEALKKLELFLNDKDGITLVKGNQKPRCFYCASLNDESSNQCSQCGATL